MRGAGVGAAGLAGAALIGCGADEEEPGGGGTPSGGGGGTPAPSTGTPAAGGGASGGSMVYGHGYPGNTMDPNSTALNPTEYYAVFDTLVRMNADGGFDPALAESWEIDSQDPTKWIFNLRDAEWSDGTKFTAEDVKFTFDYIANPDNQSSLISRVSTVVSVEVEDEKTVVFTTDGPDPILDRRQFLVFILPKHFMEDPSRGPQALATQPVGTGAYILERYQQGSQILLTKSPSSWRGTRGMDRVDMQIIPEDTTRIAAFQRGSVDFVNRVPIPEVERVSQFAGAELLQAPAAGFHGWDLDNFEGPTADVRVRLAFNHAVDMEAIRDTVYRGTTKIMQGQPLTSATFGFNPDIPPYEYNPDLARELLAEAGYADGFDSVMEMRSDLGSVEQAHAQAVADYLGEIGVRVQIRPIELNVWREGLYGRAPRAPIFWNTWSSFAIREGSFALQWYSNKLPGPYYDNAEWQETYEAALVELDEQRRLELYQRCEELHHENPSSVWVVEGGTTNAYNAETMANVWTVGGPDLYLDQIEPA